VEAVIKTSSVNTDNNMRDGDLKGNYFEVEKYPDMKFTSTKVEKRGDQWVATGPLTIKDVTKTVEIPFEVTQANTQFGPTVGASSDFKVNRNDYHVAKAGIADNGATVGNEISIELNVEAHQPKAK
jgi:polyisoprenoid-binding protein YceI